MLEPLPRQLQPVSGESGVGFCLRSVAANGLDMHWLRRQLGVSVNKVFTQTYARPLASLFGCDPDWMTHALPAEVRVDGSRTWCYRGHHLACWNHLRLRRPQVCVPCLHRGDAACLASWELSLVTVCGSHGCPLVDVCGHCHKPLRWERPAVDICHCGRPIAAPTNLQGDLAPARDIAWALGQRISGEAEQVTPFQALGLLPVLDHLSLGGLLATLHAFGALSRPHEPAEATVATKSRSSAEWRAIAVRACERLRQSEADPSEICCVLLERAAACVQPAHAEEATWALLERMGGPVTPARRRAQLSLFEGI